MVDDGKVPITKLDQSVDSDPKVSTPAIEKYKGPIAGKPERTSKKNDGTKRSWTMSEVDRVIENQILPSKSARLSKFALNFNRTNDFRLRNFGERLSNNLKRDFATEIAMGKSPTRIREFDIQSQTMRMVAANASLGSFQFQKTHTLPYMRKSLSLGYQTVDVLKRISGGIKSLEKGMLSKLEAIKMNTSAPETAKSSFYRRIKDEITTNTVRKIAGSISSVLFEGYDRTYKKYATPAINKIQSILHSDSHRGGGVNGLIKAASHGLNSVRQKTREMGNAEPDGTLLGKLKRGSSRIASSALSPLVKYTQKGHLSQGKNSFVSSLLKSPVDFVAKVDPFGDGTSYPDENGLIPSSSPGRSDLAGSINKLHKDYLSHTATMIRHLAAIEHNTSLTDAGTLKKGLGKSFKFKNSGRLPKPDVKTPGKYDYEDPTEKMFDSVIEKAKNLRKKKTTPSPEATDEGKEKKAPRKGIFSKIKDKIKEMGAKKPGTISDKKDTHGDDRKDIKELNKELAPKTPQKVEKPKGGRSGPLSGLGAKMIAVYDSLKDAGSDLIGDITGSIGDSIKEAMEGGGNDENDGSSKSKRKSSGKKGRTASRKRMTSRRRLATAIPDIEPVKKGPIKRVMSSMYKNGILGRTSERLEKSFKGRLLKNTVKLGGKAVGAVGGAYANAGKMAGGLALKGAGAGLGMVGRGALSIATSSIGKAGAVGIVAGLAGDYLHKNTTGTTQRLVDTATSALQYGSMGAAIGGPWGAAIGGAVGAIVANSDLISQGFSTVASGISSVAKTVYQTAPKLSYLMLGPLGMTQALLTDNGRKKFGYMFGNIRDSFFGTDAKYDKTGKLISPGKKSFIEGVKDSWTKLLFGDQSKTAPSKKSTLDQIGDNISAFAKGLKDKAGSLATGIGAGASTVAGVVQKYTTGLGNNAQGGGGYVYNPGDTKGKKAEGTTLQRAKQVYTILTNSLKWSAAAAQGIIANMIHESNINPHGPAGDGGKAIGIGQWHPDRQANIARKFGKSIPQMNLEEQVRAYDWELRGGDKTAGAKAFPILQRTNDPAEAAAAVTYHFERPADKHGEARRRGATARDLASQLAGAVGIPSANAQTPPGGTTPTKKAASPHTPASAWDKKGGPMAPTGKGAVPYKPMMAMAGGFSAADFPERKMAGGVRHPTMANAVRPVTNPDKPKGTAVVAAPTGKPIPIKKTVAVAVAPANMATTPIGKQPIPAAYAAPVPRDPAPQVTGPAYTPPIQQTPGQYTTPTTSSDMSTLIKQLAKNAIALDENTKALLNGGSAASKSSVNMMKPGTTSMTDTSMMNNDRPNMTTVIAPNNTNVSSPQQGHQDVVMSMKKIMVQTG